MEPIINHQILLLSILLNKDRMSLQSIQEKTGFSPSKIKVYLQQLEKLFQGAIHFEWNKDLVHCTVLTKERSDFLTTIYKQSTRLQVLKFLLTETPHHKVKSVSAFAKKHFISTPSAYRLIQSMNPFIEECGLKLEDNHIFGDELRLRYLIALLHAKYGLVIYDISQTDLDVIHSLIYSIKNYKQVSPFLDKKFLFFDLLLTLSWKRREFGVTVPRQPIFRQLKTLSIYHYLDSFFNTKGKELLGISFPSSEIDYIFLVYLTVNNSFLLTQWSEEDFSILHDIVDQDSHYQELLQQFRQLFGQYISFDKDCIRSLMPYLRKTLFELQIFIPEKYYYASNYQGSHQLVKTVEKALNNWGKCSKGVGLLTGSNLYLFCLRLEQLIRESLPPLKIAIIEINKKHIDILYSLAIQEVCPRSVAIYHLHFLSEEIENIARQDWDVIMTTSELKPFIKEQLAIPPKTTIIGLNFDFLRHQARYLAQVIGDLKEKQYQKALDSILDQNSSL